MSRVCYILYFLFVGVLGVCVVDGLGVNWGTMATHKLPPKTVVQMLKDNGIQKVKLFDADSSTMNALVGTDIEVMVAIPNDQLAVMNSYHRAKDWVKHNVTRYLFNGGVNIKFYNGLLPRLAGHRGTPLRPGYIEVYLFGFIDEDAKSIAPGYFERHWGIFRYDGQPKFPMDLSGKGQNKLLLPAQNVHYLPKKWCVFNSDAKDLSKLAENIDLACTFSDCTPLQHGSSCNGLDANGKASYAFNMYFQTQNQAAMSCTFQGLAKVTEMINISHRNCNFTIEIASSNSSSFSLVRSLVPVALVVIMVFMFSLQEIPHPYSFMD